MRTKRYGYHPKALRADSLTDEQLRGLRRMGYRTQRKPFGKDLNKRIVVKAPPPPKSCDTNLERAVEEILNDLGYIEGRDFKKQYPACGYYLDFAFPRIKLAIEPGARYWHNDREHSFEPEKDEILRLDGWKILWYDEEDLSNSERVKEEIGREFSNFKSKNTSLN